MKQIWPNYSYSPTTNVLTLTGLNIDRDQLLLVSAPERGRIMYNFADSTVTASAFTAGANTGLTLVASTAGLTTTASLVIYYDDQLQSTAITISNFPASQTTTFGAVTGSVSVLNFPTSQAVTFTDASLTNTQLRASAVTVGGTVTASISGTVPVSGTFFQTTQPVSLSTVPTHGVTIANTSVTVNGTFFQTTQPVSLASLPSLIAGTAQIGSVTASISGTVPISIASVTIGNSITIGSLPAISGTVTASALGIDYLGTQQQIPVEIKNNGIGDKFIPIAGEVITRNNGINNDPWVYIPRLTMSHPDLGNITFDGYYRFNGVNSWGTNNFNAGNVPYLTRGMSGGDEYIFKIMVHDDGNDVEISMAEGFSASPDFPTEFSPAFGTLVSGSLRCNTEQRESYSVRVTGVAISSTAITSGSFTSLASDTIVPANTQRKMATIYNLGAGQLFINAGATASTLGGGFMVALSSGDYFECDYTTTTLSAIFATSGTASWVSH